MNISIHAPREGSDVHAEVLGFRRLIFLSTLPVRGATVQRPLYAQVLAHFYPRSP